MKEANQVNLLNDRQLGRYGVAKDIFALDSWPKRLCLTKKLEKHRGCVNAVGWNHDGSLLIAGSDDQHLSIWSGHTFRLLDYIPTFHSNNIFCAKFIPDSGDSQIISCAADGEVHYLDLGHPAQKPNGVTSGPRGTRPISEHYNNIAMKFEFLPTCPSAFLTTHQDGTVCLIDTRSIQRDCVNEEIVVHLQHRLSCFSLCFDPLQPNIFALSSSDHLIRLYDIRVPSRPYLQSCKDGACIQKFCHPKLIEKYSSRATYRRVENNATDVQFSSTGELLVNYSSFDLVLFDAHQSNWSTSDMDDNICTSVIQQYKGRVNRDTFLKEARFYGSEKYVVTGSDSGEVLIWDKKTGVLIRKMPADKLVVNGIAPHPLLPTLATCGIDSDVKIFESDFGRDLDNSAEVAHHYCPVLDNTFVRSLSYRYRSREGFDTELLTIQQAQKNIESARKCYSRGMEMISNENISQAVIALEQGLELMNYYPPGLAQRKEQRQCKMDILLKLMYTYKDLSKWEKVVHSSSSVLEMDENHLDALYLRSLAYFRLDQLIGAWNDASRATLLSPKLDVLRELKKLIKDRFQSIEVEMNEEDSDENESYEEISFEEQSDSDEISSQSDQSVAEDFDSVDDGDDC